ncbi:sugar ABC transporter permease [Desulfobotulus sp. H1]|uniref:sn-glycerol-3-phosphate transport system permease protein UgpA n=1 Tax=Desulfobotulus pelophilus TaxID=2823377 RepID=A0ABT3N7S9_9BACT|nr:sugar ABC transporter permease [Desulfobotulus pelophilus]MCW7753522.1 sugar ABC transporter permease [Desulfobotulus pelophilus]
MTSFSSNRWLGLLLLLPTLLILIVFLYTPILETLRLSFYQVSFLGLREEFCGLSNYRDLFFEPGYRRMFRATLIFTFFTVTGSMGLGLLLAIMIHNAGAWKGLYRLFLIWPYALSPAVAGVIFLFLFSNQVGIVNAGLNAVFGRHPDWLARPGLAMGVVVGAAIWKNVGYNVIFYLAALSALPRDVLEAARMDGAGMGMRFGRVLLPLLAPMTLFLLVVNLMYAVFDVFPVVDLITRGGPSDATLLMIYSLYRDGFEFLKTGMAAAQSVLLLGAVAFLSFVKFRIYGKGIYYGGRR